MGTISQKLTYLNDTKGLLKDSINSLGGNITSQTTFRNYATELDSIYSRLPKVSGTGSSISLTPTLKGRLGSVINGDTFQQTYTGKNLISTNEFTLHRTNKRTIQINFTTPLPAGTYTISWKIASQSGLTSTAPMGWALYNGSTNIGSLPQIYDGITTTSSTKTTTQQITHLYAYINSNASSDATITIENLQVELNSSPTSYEPYVGGTASPNPDYPQEIKSVTGLQKVSVKGKNLFDNTKPNIYFNNSNSFIKQVGASTTNYIPAKQGDIFTISALDHSNGIVIASFDENYNCLERSAISTASNIRPLTHTCPEGTAYIIGSNYVYTDNPTQLEHGSTASEYQEYQSQEYEINLGKNLFDKNNTTLGRIDTSGVVATISGYYTSDFIKVEPNTTYTKNSPTSDAYHRFAFYSSNDTSTFISTSNNNTIITPSNCNYLRFCGIDTEVNTAQLEKGSQTTTYSPYFTPIHLYEGDQIIGTPYNWSIKHVIGEVVLDGSESYYTMGNWGEGKYAYRTSVNNSKIITSGDVVPNIKSNHYINYSTNQVARLIVPNYGISNRLNQSEIIIRNDDCSTSQELKTWLSTHNTKVVYELAEPTTEPITNTELIEQLNAFYNAKSYNGQTNISVEGDLSMILDVSAIIGD